jgi:AraC-like DNA-binding protein
MPGGGTCTFLDPLSYEASLRDRLIEAVITFSGPFAARTTSVELHHAQLLRCEDDHPRIAYLSLAAQAVFVTFPILCSLPPLWRSAELRPGDIVFHSRGDRLHQRTAGRCVWGAIAIDPEELEDHSRALCGTMIAPPADGRILRPAARDAARLRRLHAQACRLAETKAKMLTHPEVARAIEHGLLHALVCCLGAPEAPPGAEAKARHVGIMVRLEEVLASHLTRPLRMPDLCRLIGVSGESLRASCAEFLGMTPGRYVLLRRLRQARIALRGADPPIPTIADLAHACGFGQSGRFIAAYRAAFGETPATARGRVPRTNLTGR